MKATTSSEGVSEPKIRSQHKFSKANFYVPLSTTESGLETGPGHDADDCTQGQEQQAQAASSQRDRQPSVLVLTSTVNLILL
jgi:hypothetical protein